MKALRAAFLAVFLATVSLAQTITLPTAPAPNYVSNNWLFFNKVRWAGAWSSTTTYNPQDMVTNAGYTFVSLSAANLNNTPTAGGTIYWAKLPTAAATWGTIGGTLANQTDLNTALNGKQSTITTGSGSQYFNGTLGLSTFSTSVYSALGFTAPITFNSSTGVYGCATCLINTGSYPDPAWLSLTVAGGRMSGTWPASNGGTGSAAPTARGRDRRGRGHAL